VQHELDEVHRDHPAAGAFAVCSRPRGSLVHIAFSTTMRHRCSALERSICDSGRACLWPTTESDTKMSNDVSTIFRRRPHNAHRTCKLTRSESRVSGISGQNRTTTSKASSESALHAWTLIAQLRRAQQQQGRKAYLPVANRHPVPADFAQAGELMPDARKAPAERRMVPNIQPL
jgi:hypothetical protein